jgi:hypothetical protein
MDGINSSISSGASLPPSLYARLAANGQRASRAAAVSAALAAHVTQVSPGAQQTNVGSRVDAAA